MQSKDVSWIARLSSIMKDAWRFFRNGIVSFSLSLKLSWKVAKGEITTTQIKKMLEKFL